MHRTATWKTYNKIMESFALFSGDKILRLDLAIFFPVILVIKTGVLSFRKM